MPYDYPQNVPKVSINWAEEEKKKCTAAANAVLKEGGSEEDAIFACIHAAGKSKEKSMENLDINVVPYYYDSQNRLNLLVRAVPFGGPVYLNDKDLKGHSFHKSTDLGVSQAVSYLDHNKLKINHPELDVARFPGIDERIGISEKALTDEEGVIYRIIVDEGYRYKNMLKVIASQNGWLGSTTPNQRSVKFNEKDASIIDRWEVGEVTLTWKAANPDAELIFLKSIEMEDVTMSKVKDEKVEEGKVEEVVTEEIVAAESTETPLTDLVAELNSAEVAEKSVMDMFGEIMNMLTGFDVRIGNIEMRTGMHEKSMDDLKTAFPMLVKQLDKYFTGKVQQEKSVSHVEKSVAQKFEQKATSSTAPGRERRANFGMEN